MGGVGLGGEGVGGRGGAHDGGPPMLHVYSKKWQCRMSLSLIFSNVTCQIKEKSMLHVPLFVSPCRMSLSPMSNI